MQQNNLLLLIIGIFIFCIYWFAHGLISFWIYRDSIRRNSSPFGWVGSYIGLSFFNMLIWLTILILPLLKPNIRIETSIIVSAIIAVVSLPSMFTLLFYSLSKREMESPKPVVEEGRKRGKSLDKTIRFKVTDIAKDAELINLNYPGLRDRLPLNEGETTLGRSYASNHISFVKDEMVSKEHGVIKKEDDQYVLTDLGSAHGTFLEREGKRDRITKPTPLENNDVIYLGPSIKLQFVRKL